MIQWIKKLLAEPRGPGHNPKPLGVVKPPPPLAPPKHVH